MRQAFFPVVSTGHEIENYPLNTPCITVQRNEESCIPLMLVKCIFLLLRKQASYVVSSTQSRMFVSVFVLAFVFVFVFAFVFVLAFVFVVSSTQFSHI